MPQADKCLEENQLRRVPVFELPTNESIPASAIGGLLDLLEESVVIADRSGRVLQTNRGGKQCLASHGFSLDANLNLISDMLHIHPTVIVDQIDGGNQRRTIAARRRT